MAVYLGWSAHLVDLRAAREERFARQELHEHAADAPHVGVERVSIQAGEAHNKYNMHEMDDEVLSCASSCLLCTRAKR